MDDLEAALQQIAKLDEKVVVLERELAEVKKQIGSARMEVGLLMKGIGIVPGEATQEQSFWNQLESSSKRTHTTLRWAKLSLEQVRHFSYEHLLMIEGIGPKGADALLTICKTLGVQHEPDPEKGIFTMTLTKLRPGVNLLCPRGMNDLAVGALRGKSLSGIEQLYSLKSTDLHYLRVLEKKVGLAFVP